MQPSLGKGPEQIAHTLSTICSGLSGPETAKSSLFLVFIPFLEFETLSNRTILEKRLLFLTSLLFFIACNDSQPQKLLREKGQLIGISKFYPDSVIQHWLQNVDRSLQFVELYGLHGAQLDSVLQECDGILLSGGADLAPNLYGKTDIDSLCGSPDLYRDSLEMSCVNYAFLSDKPIFGICRGMQMMNVAKGGDLVMDLPRERNTSIHQQTESDAMHAVKLKEGSILALQASISEGEVNSNHHQAINKIAPGFEVIATAEDGIPEAFHFLDINNHPFAMAVQWHPERMDYKNALCREPAKLFIKAIWEQAPMIEATIKN